MIIEQISKEYYSDVINERVSDFLEFQWSTKGLKITISTWKDLQTQIEISYVFTQFSAFRYLEEGDLLSYWESPEIKDGIHIYKIIDGGWKTGEITVEGLLDLSRSIDELSEFFIVTSSGGITVLAYEKPIISEVILMG